MTTITINCRSVNNAQLKFKKIFEFFFLKNLQPNSLNQIYVYSKTDYAIIKIEISLELAKTRLRVGFKSATYCNQEILSLTHYPLNHASLTTDKHWSRIKQLHMLINCQSNSAKVAPNTNRLNFASNNL